MVTLKEKMKNKEITIGSWVTLGHSAIAEIMARAGFDWLVIDMEHSVIELSETQEMIQVMDGAKTPSIIRLTSNDANLIKRVMDAGAHGIMVPNVNSVADANRAVAATYFPPKGKRGVGLARAQGYGASFNQYCQWLNENALVIVMIEHIDGVKVVDDILAVSGIDGYMIGPYDLSASLGIPGQINDPKVIDAIATIREAGDKAGKPGGIHVVEPDLAAIENCIINGFTFIGYGMDVRILDAISRDHLSKIKGLQ